MKYLLYVSFSCLLFSCASDRPTPCECLELASDLISKMTAGEMTEEEANTAAAACSFMDELTEEELAEKLVSCDLSDLDDAANEGMKEGLEESLSKDACGCMDRVVAIQAQFAMIDTTDKIAIETKMAELEQIEVDCAWLDEMSLDDLKTFFKDCPQYLEALE